MAGSPSPDVGRLEEEGAHEEVRLKALEESKASLQQQVERLDARIRQINDELGWRRFLPESLGGISDEEEVRAMEERRENLRREVERIEDSIRGSKEALECIDTRIAGGSCDSLWGRVSKVSISQLKETFGKLNDTATSITMLLVAIAIKNVLFPIVFLMGAVKGSLAIARHVSQLLCGFEKDARKLKETIASQHGPSTRQLEQSNS